MRDKMKKIIIFGYLIIGIIVTGCIRPYLDTNVKTLLDPHYNIGVSKIIIIAPDMGNLVILESLENSFVSEFAAYNIAAIAGYKIFSPLKSYSPQEMEALMKQQGIDAYLLVEPTPSYMIKDNRIYPYNYSSGYAIEARLYLRNVSSAIWEADSLTMYHGGVLGYNSTFQSLAESIVESYTEDLNNQKELNQKK